MSDNFNLISNWCKLCGNIDTIVKTDQEHYHYIIQQILEIIPSDLLICLNCSSFLINCNEYVMKCKKIQQMFNEIHTTQDIPINKVNEIRNRYSLKPIKEIFEEEMTVENFEEAYVPEEILEPEIIEEYIFEEDEILEEKHEIEEKEISEFKSYKKDKLEIFFVYKCHICNEEFPKMQPLISHCKLVHNTSAQVECVCGKKLSTLKKLLDHKIQHFQDKNESFLCIECNLSYKTQQAYEKHKQRKHVENTEKFICLECGRSFKEKQILKNHEKIHLPAHMKFKHECNKCDKKFVNSHCLKIHIARIHDKAAYYFCEICGQGKVTKSDLQWHLDKHIEERNFSCEICSLKFKSSNALRIHRRRHMEVKTMKACSICKKEFRSSAALSNHKLVHSDEKKYKCTLCPNSYKRLESYKNHMHHHSGHRPYKCTFCPKSFINSANCRKHKLKEHAQEVAEYEAIHGKKGVPLQLTIKIS